MLTRWHALVGQLSVAALVAWGTLYYAFSVFMPAMVTELGWSEGVVASGISLALFLSACTSPLVGRWLGTLGPRLVMVGGALLGVLGLLLWSVATTLPWFLLAFALIGTAMSATFYGPAFAVLVAYDVSRSRHGILAVALVGALAATIYLPAATALQSLWGWRVALRLLALAFALVVVPSALQLPALSPIGVKARLHRQKPMGFAFGLALTDGVQAAVNMHLVIFLIGAGHSAEAAAAIAASAGIAKIVGRLSTTLAGHFTPAFLLFFSALLSSLALLLPLLSTTWQSLTLMVVVSAVAAGARTILRPLLVVERYGQTAFAGRNGWLQLYCGIGKAAGPLALGTWISLWGQERAWLVLVITSCASAGLLWFFLRPFGRRSVFLSTRSP